MFPVAAIAGAGWLLLFIVLLVAPPSPGPRQGGGPGDSPGNGGAPSPDPGDEPPAVVSLLAGRLDKLGFGATLIDLAARGWFEVRAPGGPPAGTNVAWSSYRGSWQQIEIEKNTWPWPRACLIVLAIIFGQILYVGAAIWLVTHGMVVLAAELGRVHPSPQRNRPLPPTASARRPRPGTLPTRAKGQSCARGNNSATAPRPGPDGARVRDRPGGGRRHSRVRVEHDGHPGAARGRGRAGRHPAGRADRRAGRGAGLGER